MNWKCLKCWLRRFYWRMVSRSLKAGNGIHGKIVFSDVVVATLIKDGDVIRQVEGRGHNKWRDDSLEDIADALRVGGSGTTPLKVLYMRLGSQCSDTSFSAIAATQQATTNTDVNVKQTKFTAEWAAAGAITGICQAALEQQDYTGVGYDYASYYNFVTTFNKPDGVALRIEWTTTLAAA